MANEDIKFSFDDSAIIEGLKAIEKKLGSVEGSYQKTNQAIETGMQKTGGRLKAGFTKVTAIIGAVTAGVFAIRGALSALPEVGKGLSIMKDIFTRNFLWPLRQQIMPILMRMLKWFRENRGTFVKWGRIFLNIIKVVIRLGKVLLNVLNKTVGRALRQVKKLFFSGINSIEEFMNILVFKIAAITEYLAVLLKPFSKLMGDILEEIIKFGVRFGKTFKKAFEDIDLGPLEKSLTKLWKAAKNLWKYLSPIVNAAIDVYFETLGKVLKNIVVPAVKNYIKYVKLAATAITFLIKKVKPFFDTLGSAIKTVTDNPAFKVFMGFVENLTGLVSAGFKGVGDLFDKAAQAMEVDDAIITKEGKVIKTNPQDDIFAMKRTSAGSPMGGGTSTKNLNVSVDMSGMNITVTEGNAEKAGAMFAESFMEQFESALDKSLEAQGA